MVRLYQYLVVEPTATVPGRLRSTGEVARDSSIPIVFYPEGTHTRDVRLGSWREGGLRVILGVCQWTVCLIVVDGLWQTARLTDFVKKVSSIDSRSVVVGPFVSSESGTDPEPFIVDMCTRMKAAFTGLRSEALER